MKGERDVVNSEARGFRDVFEEQLAQDVGRRAAIRVSRSAKKSICAVNAVCFTLR